MSAYVWFLIHNSHYFLPLKESIESLRYLWLSVLELTRKKSSDLSMVNSKLHDSPFRGVLPFALVGVMLLREAQYLNRLGFLEYSSQSMTIR